MRELTAQGIGLHTKQTDSVTYDNEEELWRQKILNAETPKGLQRTLFYLIGVNFALRGGQAHRTLTVENFTIMTDASGSRYFEYKEVISKTHHGGLKDLKIQQHSARAYENVQQRERCIVTTFEK
jgi:hypothetical protein